MKVNQIINSFHASNTYLIELNKEDVVLIDCGDPDTGRVINWLFKHKKTPLAVILTHEHADHCAGLNSLSNEFKFDLYCSPACLTGIRDEKQNLSLYIEYIQTFTVCHDAKVIRNGQSQLFKSKHFSFFETPGHSPGGICIIAGNSAFTGDTILNGVRSPLSFPHSNRIDYRKSLEKLFFYLHPGMTIYPGHGKPFAYNSYVDICMM